MVKTKVFVGNLSFKTQNSDLAKYFEVAGKVASANVILRGSRSLGYGFVEMESEEEARKAVELLNKKSIDDREINVEVARPRDENAPREPRQPRPRVPRPAGSNPAAAGAAGAASGQRRRGPPRDRKPNGGVRRSSAPKTPSPNTLFVANLPFSVDDKALSDIFAGLNLKTAHVVRKHNQRSKGFGFVEFHNSDDQTKALAAIDKKTVGDRQLTVKVALTEAAGDKAAALAITSK